MLCSSIGNACYGLRMRDTGDMQEHWYLHWLLRSVDRMVLNAQAIGNACYGLQGVRDIGDSAAVGALVSALATKISTSDAVLNAQGIGNACYGLQGVRDIGDSAAVGSLVSALATKISTHAVLDAQAIGNACYGLKDGDTGDSGRNWYLHWLKIRTSDAVLDAQHIGNACYGS